MACPTRCSGRNQVRPLLDGERQSIVEQDPEVAEHISSNAHRCPYCGLVFEPSSPTKRLGTYGDPIRGNGFDWTRHPTLSI